MLCVAHSFQQTYTDGTERLSGCNFNKRSTTTRAPFTGCGAYGEQPWELWWPRGLPHSTRTPRAIYQSYSVSKSYTWKMKQHKQMLKLLQLTGNTEERFRVGPPKRWHRWKRTK